VIPALALALGGMPPDDRPAPDPEGTTTLGRLAGRTLSVTVRGATVLIGWGDLLPACLDAHRQPGRSAGPAIRATWGPRPPQRAGAFWPGRLPGLAAGTPLAVALDQAPPILWWGEHDSTRTRD